MEYKRSPCARLSLVGLLSVLLSITITSLYHLRDNDLHGYFHPLLTLQRHKASADEYIPYIYDPAKIAVVQVVTDSVRDRYAKQMSSVQCWADRVGYQYIPVLVGQEFPECVEKRYDGYYLQWCALGELMQSHYDIEYFVKVDADVVAGFNDRSLEHWLDGSDMIIQERLYTAELTSGFVGVRNTMNGRGLITDWQGWYFRRDQSRGWHGNDNGSLHMVVLDGLGLQGRAECAEQYIALTTGDSFSKYFEFVACTRLATGPPRRHRSPTTGVRISIWPAAMGPMIETLILLGVAKNLESLSGYYPFHHGVKNTEDPYALKNFGPPDTYGLPDHNEHGSCIGLANDGTANEEGNHTISMVYSGYTRPHIFNPDPLSLGFDPEHLCFDAYPARMAAKKEALGQYGTQHFRVPRWALGDLERPQCLEDYWSCTPLDPDEVCETKGYRCIESEDSMVPESERDGLKLSLTEVLSARLPEYT